ncbi:MAG TPA: XrtA/PEP-CTERM system-associated ATPase [Burkholderiaceae bacterium]|nr:XrtA/PEP-CTERM system-associated ATPase [Burkholderiaceae bacterium]
MYEAHYGLSTKPFQLNPDPSFYFDSKQHRRAKAYLEYGVMCNEGFIVITGEIGAGKTTILGGLLKNLNRNDVVVGQLVTTQLDAEDTLRMVGAAFGFRVQGLAKSELLITLEAFLINQASQGKRCLLIVDEAQNLTPRAVEELRMISNYQLGTQSLLQSFLVGQPEFREILQRREMEQFRQRVAATCHIGPLDLEDTQAYIQHRLKTAGATDKPTFEAGAFDAIFNASQGVPRRINSICDRLLLLGYLNGRTHLSVEDVNEVVREFAREVGSPGTAPPVGPGKVNGSAYAFNGRRESAAPATGTEIEAAKLEIDAAKLELDSAAAEEMSRRIGSLTTSQQADRLLRLERSVLRLERMNLETLSLLKALVQAVRKPAPTDDELEAPRP